MFDRFIAARYVDKTKVGWGPRELLAYRKSRVDMLVNDTVFNIVLGNAKCAERVLAHTTSAYGSENKRTGLWFGELFIRELMDPRAEVKEVLGQLGVNGLDFLRIAMLEESQHFRFLARRHDKLKVVNGKSNYGKVIEHEEFFHRCFQRIINIIIGEKSGKSLKLDQNIRHQNMSELSPLSEIAEIILYHAHSKTEAQDKQAARHYVHTAVASGKLAIKRIKDEDMATALVVSDELNEVEYNRIKDLDVCRNKKIKVYRESDYVNKDSDLVLYVGTEEKDMPELIRAHASLFLGTNALSNERISAALNIELFVYELMRKGLDAKLGGERAVVSIADVLPDIAKVPGVLMDKLRDALREVYNERALKQSA